LLFFRKEFPKVIVISIQANYLVVQIVIWVIILENYFEFVLVLPEAVASPLQTARRSRFAISWG